MDRRTRRVFLIIALLTLATFSLFALTVSAQIAAPPRADLTPILITLPAPMSVYAQPTNVFLVVGKFGDMNGEDDGLGYTYKFVVKEVGGTGKIKYTVDPTTCLSSCAVSLTQSNPLLTQGSTYQWSVKAKGGDGVFAKSAKHYFGLELVSIPLAEPGPNQRLFNGHVPPNLVSFQWPNGPFNTFRLQVKRVDGGLVYDSGMTPAQELCIVGTCVKSVPLPVEAGELAAFEWQVTGMRPHIAGKSKSEKRRFFVAGGS